MMSSSTNTIAKAILTISICILLTNSNMIAAQSTPQTTLFAEVKILINENFTLDQIRTLSPAPASKQIISDDSSYLITQISADQLEALQNSGTDITTLRRFVLITPPANKDNSEITAAGTDYVQVESDLDVDIPSDGSWAGSGITISGAPSSATVTNLDVHYEIESSWIGYVYIDLTDNDYQNFSYRLVDGTNGFINETQTSISAFNGRTINQTWILWAAESYSSGDGYIDYWWLKLYYDDGGGSTEEYCDATGGCEEYISNVLVADIDNSSNCDGYTDYNDISTEMQISESYPITVTNGNPYEGDDQCGIWVDWNQDFDFDDENETIPVIGSPGDGPYTATITPPADANLGETKMRIRIAYNQTPSPCGSTNYGEVEDYTIIVTPAVQPITISGTVTLSDGSPLTGVLLEAYNSPSTPTGITDTSDANGCYEITLDAPWSGYINAAKDHYNISSPNDFTNITTDQTQNFYAYYTYDGGLGTPSNPYLIATPQQLNAIGLHPEDFNKNFKLIADIDLSQYTGTQYNIIGDFYDPPIFSGIFDGNDHIISNFTYTSTDTFGIGLFGGAGGNDTNTEIKNLTIVDPNIDAGTGGDVGAIVGVCYKSITISDCKILGGTIKAAAGVGGLLGANFDGNYIKCSSSADIIATTTTEHSRAGGLIGIDNFGTIDLCYTSGSVTGKDIVGGLIGATSANGSITNCYSKAAVTAESFTGGLIGYNSAPVNNCYAVGTVSATGNYVSGLIGAAAGGPITNCFWDVNTTGQTDPWVGTGLTTEQMQTKSTFTDVGWDFTNETANGPNDFWRICESTNYPKLAWQTKLPGDITCPDGIDMLDFATLANQWQLQILSADFAQDQPDGIVNFKDFSALANAWLTENLTTLSTGSNNWNEKCDIAPSGGGDLIINNDDLQEFANQWLQQGAHNADIAPQPTGDGTVDILDLALITENWLNE